MHIKKRGTFSIFPLRGVWRNPTEEYNQKPAPSSASTSTIIPFCLLVAKLSEQQNKS